MPINYKVNFTAENFLPYSEEFDNGLFWDKTSYPVTMVRGATTGPYSGMVAYSVVQQSGGLFIQNITDLSIIGTGIQVCSVYAKAYTSSSFTLNCYYSVDTEVNTTFNLSTGTVTSGSGTITSVANGWYRCSIQVPARVNSGGFFLYRIWPDTRGLLTSNGCYFSGAQVNNTTLKSYIKTFNKANRPNFVGQNIDDILATRELFNSGNLWAFGRDGYGQVGNSSTVSVSSPVTTTGGGSNWKQISFGVDFSFGIKSDGTLWTWGLNNGGQLATNNSTNYSSPVTTAAGGTNWKQVSSGSSHAAAVKTDGTLWIWGTNGNGQLGTNNITNYISPVTTAAGGTTWKQVTCGDQHTSAIKTDGTLWTWGYNNSGQLGDNTIVDKSSPNTTAAGGNNWKQLAVGDQHTAAIKTDGTLWTWGNNYNGQLGDNTTVNKSSPVTTAAGGTNWKQVACGQAYTAAIKTDGTLWLWGYNFYGQLGTNNTTNYSSPVTTVAGGTTWKQVSSGHRHTAAIKTDGTLWLWGYNTNYGQLGTNNTINYSSPVTTVAGGTNWKQVSTGYWHTGAITDLTI